MDTGRVLVIIALVLALLSLFISGYPILAIAVILLAIARLI